METNITINSLALFISLDCVQCTINRIKPVTTYGNQHHHQLLSLFISLDCVQCTINRIKPVTTYGNQHHHQLLSLFISLDCVQCTINRIKPVTTYGNQHHHQLLGSFYLFRLCPMYNKQNKASYNIWKPTSPSTPWLFLSL